MMKSFKVRVTATLQRDVFITADTLQDAYNEAFEMFADDALSEFESEDIIAFTGEVTEDLDNEFCNFDCDSCPDCCDECGSCLLENDNYTSEKDCFDCKFYCDECGACNYDEDYIDEELELRKMIFSDFLDKTFKGIEDYANALFLEE